MKAEKQVCKNKFVEFANYLESSRDVDEGTPAEVPLDAAEKPRALERNLGRHDCRRGLCLRLSGLRLGGLGVCRLTCGDAAGLARGGRLELELLRVRGGVGLLLLRERGHGGGGGGGGLALEGRPGSPVAV